jgi:hypothetical protein
MVNGMGKYTNQVINIGSAFVLLLVCPFFSLSCSQIVGSNITKSAVARPVASWQQQSKNTWLSSTGISLVLYSEAEAKKNTSSARFWDAEPLLSPQFGKGHHTAEAENLLKKMSPGSEIETSAFFRRSSDYRWPLNTPSNKCPPNASCGTWPYLIRYLHRPASGWKVDRLMSYGIGVLNHKLVDNRDTYTISDGPYQPIFEGRFIKGTTVKWFIAQDTKQNKVAWTTEMRFATLRDINDLLNSQ